ncbi:MAG: hypothetical protein AVDCRST_MAG33-991 [uncultured Thermomicrobiales bacterium]|uniref:FAD dependent oxidoreductase domain-containing protein n=1 Tax=uncultured Thermomicrobiales bacterium TaxID=1645740 RepID=A0A6J4UL31_9BACT|nr:MAG: hypothetical protein AVDCRST_MAG33-991 [uncultured Thermomicrobiales bacterium]
MIDSSFPTDADVVVIGAGALGLATTFALARAGAGRVVLLDQFEPATQASARAAGLFKLLQFSEVKTRLAARSMAIVRGFEAETGVPLPFVDSGSIYAARTPQHASMVEAEVEDGRGWGVELVRIDNAEAHRLAPYLAGNNLLSAYLVPGDIYVEEPRSMLLAFWQAAERLGARVIGHAPVTGIRVEGGAVTAVETPHGEIRTPLVVDSAGVWSRIVGRMAGADVPVQPVRHHLRITSPVAGIEAKQPVVRLIDAATYVRPARGGVMYGGFEQDPLALDPETIEGFSMDKLPFDHHVNDRFRDAVIDEFPDLATTTVQEQRGGMFTMTADGMFLVGPSDAARGFWVASGCNGSGFSLSAGIGSVLAEWIVGGAPPFDVSALDPNRFATENLSDEELRGAGIWQYVNYYTPAGA